MNCPICNKTMVYDALRSRTTIRKSDQKKYNCSVYHCEIDDAWVSTEIPQSHQTPEKLSSTPTVQLSL